MAQQWIDYLDENPEKKYLQFAHSEGAVHTNAALRLIHTHRPDLLSRIRVINLCPAHFILPETYGHGLQVMNFYKKEDGAINPWAANISHSGRSGNIVCVDHREDHPHNPCASDYAGAARRYMEEFSRTGNLY